MKIKQAVLSALICVSLFAFSSAVFADGDSPDSAKPVKQREFASGYINEPYEADWFKWENNTDKTQIVKLYLASPYWVNYDIIAVYAHDGEYYTAPAVDYGANGHLDSFEYGYVAPGYTAYWKIVPHDRNQYSTTKNYYTWFTVK